MRRAGGSIALAAMLVLLLAPARASAAAWTEADYWRFIDRMQERLDESWQSRRGLYRPGDMTSDSMVNANALLVHSVAALRGHSGPSRQDDRARVIAARMVGSPPFVDVLSRQFGQRHAPGWGGSMTSTVGMQHLVVDAEIAEALATAWRARDVIGLPPDVSAAISDRLHRVAISPFYRYPAIRLNQLNWHAAIYSAAAETTGDLSLLHNDLRAQAVRFVRGIRRPAPGTAGNLGPGMRFHYLPHAPKTLSRNFDSAEYANIVASFARFWDGARARGMATLPAADRTLLRRWMRRVLAGYWTHSGYLNWDTGFGFGRLHQAKKVGLAQQGVLAIAAGGELAPGGSWPAWAKYVLDHGFELYERWLPEESGWPAATLFDLNVNFTTPSHSILAGGRVQANAARAIAAGLGGRRSEEPPPLYAFDPDVGRLAVTTPRYSTAIVPVSQGAFPYGGIDIARLFDGRSDVAGNVGGVPPASFGLVVRDAVDDIELVTQRPRRRPPVRRAPLRLLRAPSGVGAKLDSPPLRAYADTFETLDTTGMVERGKLTARTAYRFRRNSILAGWTFRARDRRRHTVEVHFPSWRGDTGVGTVTAVMTDGQRLAVEPEFLLPLAEIDHFEISSDRASYRVVPVERPRGAVVGVVQPRNQASEPRPGPTLAVRLAYRDRVRGAAFRALIVPDP